MRLVHIYVTLLQIVLNSVMNFSIQLKNLWVNQKSIFAKIPKDFLILVFSLKLLLPLIQASWLRQNFERGNTRFRYKVCIFFSSFVISQIHDSSINCIKNYVNSYSTLIFINQKVPSIYMDMFCNLFPSVSLWHLNPRESLSHFFFS